MKILYTTDLHGDPEKYKKMYRIAKDEHVDTIVNGGDMLPKYGRIYSKQRKFISRFLDEYFNRLQSERIRFLGCLGNDDLSVFDGLFDHIVNKYDGIFNIAKDRVKLNGFEFIGMNFVADYPFRLKDRCRADTRISGIPHQNGKALLSSYYGWKEIAYWNDYIFNLPFLEDELGRLPIPVDFKKAIYIFHMPPSNVDLDLCYHGGKVGSNAIYKFISKKQPLLTLHGHIHEAPDMSGIWFNYIGKTICIQPGQKKSLTYVKINLSDLTIDRVTI